MTTNNLPIIRDAYLITRESLTTVKFIVQKQAHYPKLIARLPHLTADSTARTRLNKSLQEVDDLFVVNLWSSFERTLRDYFQIRGELLKTMIPTSLGEEVYRHFANKVDYWKPEDMLEILKKSLFTQFSDNQRLAGHAKQIYHYRNWIAHGRNPNKTPPAAVTPEATYTTLKTLVELLPS